MQIRITEHILNDDLQSAIEGHINSQLGENKKPAINVVNGATITGAIINNYLTSFKPEFQCFVRTVNGLIKHERALRSTTKF